MHIRQVLVKAELEKYQQYKDVYTALKKGKVELFKVDCPVSEWLLPVTVLCQRPVSCRVIQNFWGLRGELFIFRLSNSCSSSIARGDFCFSLGKISGKFKNHRKR